MLIYFHNLLIDYYVLLLENLVIPNYIESKLLTFTKKQIKEPLSKRMLRG